MLRELENADGEAGGMRLLAAREPAPEAANASVQSAETCLSILKILMLADGPKSLKDLAGLANISPSKAHRYLQTLVTSGFASQGRRSGRYDLGTMAMTLGFAALERVDLVNRTADHLEELAMETACQVMLSVWGERGPVIVRIQNSGSGFEAANRLGSRRPLWTSATGNVFLAFLSRHATALCLSRELECHRSPPPPEVIAERIKTVRAAGYAVTPGSYMEGVAGIAAPVIDMQNDACAVVTLVKPLDHYLGENDPIITYLKNFCREMSVFDAPLYKTGGRGK